MNDEDYRGLWTEGFVRCRVCNHRHVAVAPWPEPGLDNLECPHCGCFACDGDDDETVVGA